MNKKENRVRIMADSKDVVHQIGHVMYIAFYCALIVSTILFYDSMNMIVLLYMGWFILMLGCLIIFYSAQSRRKGRESDAFAGKEFLVENGMYAFIRHPEFLGHILVISAMVAMSQHLISFVLGTILVLLLYIAMIEEEKMNIKKFGDAYTNYMKRVPKINLFAGIIRQIQQKRKY